MKARIQTRLLPLFVGASICGRHPEDKGYPGTEHGIEKGIPSHYGTRVMQNFTKLEIGSPSVLCN
jgi:hypothetical protein